MTHHQITHETPDPTHCAVSHDASGRRLVLVQLEDVRGTKLSVSLTPEQAWHLVWRLSKAMFDAEDATDNRIETAAG